jgi:mRNA-degrading endonuclease RelE of RelBE toxin-antitoxin system
MSYRYIFHSDIEKDYADAYNWYEKQKVGLGERFLTAVRKKLDQIAENPKAYGERSKKGYREANVDVFPFQIIYKIYPKTKILFINAIHHHKKDPRKKYRK